MTRALCCIVFPTGQDTRTRPLLGHVEGCRYYRGRTSAIVPVASDLTRAPISHTPILFQLFFFGPTPVPAVVECLYRLFLHVTAKDFFLGGEWGVEAMLFT